MFKIVGNTFKYTNMEQCALTTGVHWERNVWQNIKIIAEGNNIKVYFKDSLILDYTDDTESAINSGTYGFISWSQADSRFKNIEIETTYTKSFDEILRGAEWRNDSIKVLVNVQDNKNEHLSNVDSLSEFLVRAISDEIHFIGWGTQENKVEINNFISSNNNNGLFIENGDYANSITKTAEYIYSLIDMQTSDEYVIVNESVELEIEPAGIDKNTTDATYTHGKWKINHDYTYYENNLGIFANSGKYLDSMITTFNKSGRYEILFEDNNVDPKYIYVHRKPVADFNIQLNGTKVTLVSTSYDLDKKSVNNGIQEEEWKYKNINDTSWTNGKLTDIVNGNDYIIQLRVKDWQGTWSTAISKSIITSAVSRPIANFNIEKNEISMYEELKILDTSYDPSGNEITVRKWEVYNSENENLVYTGETPLTNYKDLGVGTYKISLTVTNSANLVSEKFSRTFLVINAVIETHSPNLTAVVNKQTNQIELNWDMGGLELGKNHYYKVYQKKPDDNTYQTISVTDFEKPGATIKVLNVYPDVGDNLKTWMETNGFGKDIIKVTPVSITDFNTKPSSYMKDSKGEWIYDVIMFGSWDTNNSKDITYEASLLVEQFIKAGKGAIFGHDTIALLANSTSLNHPNFARLASYVNVVNRGEWTNNSSAEVYLYKEGIFTTYPWYIGTVGTILTIPTAHTLDQTAYGDIWLKFNNDIVLGNQNFYLTTWNNCAMIQTGHKKGEATEDEQKILANVIFYTNQLTVETIVDDYSGRDYASPSNIKNAKYEFDKKGGFRYTFTPSIDNGSEYSYYVQAIAKDGNSYANSNIVTETITTGLKGYSYVVDNTDGTIPDDTIDTTSNIVDVDSANIDWSSPVYMHIKAIDNVGNVSEVTHTLIEDIVVPKITLTPSTTDFTNKNVSINMTVEDLESGIQKIKLPDGSFVTSANNVYVVEENGTYTYVVYDNAGNSNTKTIVVSNIDKELPDGVITSSNTEWTNENISLTIEATDLESGIQKIELPDGSFVNKDNTTYEISQNGIYRFVIHDIAGNYLEKMIEITNIDKTAPNLILKINKNVDDLIIENTIITWDTSDTQSGFRHIVLPTGKIINENNGEFVVKENGIYTFVSYDNLGNAEINSIEVKGINKV